MRTLPPLTLLTPMPPLVLLCALAAVGVLAPPPAALADPPTTLPADAPAKAQSPTDSRTVVLHVTGLFERKREAALREAAAKMPGVRLVGIDFDHAEATFACDPAAFKGTPPDGLAGRLDPLLREASGQLLSAKPRSTVERDKLARVEVTVAPLDCKACALGVHEIVFQVPGVEQVVVDMKEGRITALVDPARADREKIRAALVRHEVAVKE